MSANRNGQGYTLLAGGDTQQRKRQTYVGGVEDGLTEWQAQTCWMISYLVFSILGLMSVIFISLYMIPGMTLAVIAGSFHVCQGCAACYGHNKRAGAQIVKILAIVSLVWNMVVSVLSFSAAAVMGSGESDVDEVWGMSIETLRVIGIVAGGIGVFHAALSVVTSVKFTRVVSTFEPVSSGQVAI